MQIQFVGVTQTLIVSRENRLSGYECADMNIVVICRCVREFAPNMNRRIEKEVCAQVSKGSGVHLFKRRAFSSAINSNF